MIQIQNYLPLVYKIIFLIIFLAKYKDIKDFVISMLSDDSKVSSKRVIAISGMAAIYFANSANLCSVISSVPLQLQNCG